jgi:NADH-quinone oxidoreductase subunit N
MFQYPLLNAVGPEFILGGIALILLIGRRRLSRIKLVTGTLATAGIVAGFIHCLFRLSGQAVSLDTIYIDSRYTQFFKLFVLAIALMTILLKSERTDPVRDKPRVEPTLWILLSCVGMMIIAGSNDFMLTYLGLELMLIPGLLLVFQTIPGGNPDESLTRILLLELFGSALMLWGIAFIVGACGSTTYSVIYDYLFDLIPFKSFLFYSGLTFFGLGVVLKTGTFPFHGWLINGISIRFRISSLFLYWTCAAGFLAIFSRLLCRLFIDYRPVWTPYLAGYTAIFMTFGHIFAQLQENRLKKFYLLLMAQQGFIILGLIAAERFIPLENLPGGVAASLYSLVAIGCASFGLISIGYHLSNNKGDSDISSFTGASTCFLSAAGIVFLLSIIGIPPTMGFIGKFFVLGSAGSAGYSWLVIVAGINVVLTAAICFSDIRKSSSFPFGFSHSYGPKVANWIVILLSLTATLFWGFFPETLAEIVRLSSKAIW